MVVLLLPNVYAKEQRLNCLSYVLSVSLSDHGDQDPMMWMQLVGSLFSMIHTTVTSFAILGACFLLQIEWITFTRGLGLGFNRGVLLVGRYHS